MIGMRDAVQQVALAGLAALGREQMAGDAVLDVDQADVGVDEHLQPPVEEREQEPAGAAGAARPLDRGRVDVDDVLADRGCARRIAARSPSVLLFS